MKKIMIAIDDSTAATKVTNAGFNLAKELNAEVSLLSVVDTNFSITDGDISPAELAEITKIELKRHQHLLIDTIIQKDIWTFVEKGNPFEIIIKTARQWQADIIVIGTHGRKGLKHLAMGSVAEKVIRHAIIPVMVVPTKKD